MSSKKDNKTYATHFEAFLAFAEEQPPTRIIDHTSNQWCGCAVGDYHREATSIPPVGQEHLVSLPDSRSPLLEELGVDHSYIFEALNNGFVNEIASDEGYEIATYLGLAKFMRAYEGDSFDDHEEFY